MRPDQAASPRVAAALIPHHAGQHEAASDEDEEPPVAVGARHARAEERTTGVEVEACVLCGQMLCVGDPMDSYQGSYRCGARDDCKRRKRARDEEMLREAGTSLAMRRCRR